MDRIAIFVDAGYFFAQGSTALTGSKKQRTLIALDAPKAIEALKSFAKEKAPDCKLLRIYWYDGAIAGARPTSDQATLASLDDVKLRLGFINNSGQQKGVDSLIVTDLVEIARLKSISDAVLLSGDEDVRIGVQIAQNYGVRVHLLGIAPARGSQSHQLLQEADTTSEWDAKALENFLSLRAPLPAQSQEVKSAQAGKVPTTPNGVAHGEDEIEQLVQLFVENLTPADLTSIKSYWVSERGVPAEFDKQLLRQCSDKLDRRLEGTEMKEMRKCFKTRVEARLKTASF